LREELFVVFKRMWQSLGVGGPSVETVLDTAACRPGGILEGHVHVLAGGERRIDVEYLAVALITRVAVTGGDGDFRTDQEFHRQRLTGSFQLEPGARHDLPFRFEVPWQTPITELYGQRLHGMTMGLSTELEVAQSVDRSDLDAVEVHPLPAQERILDALLRLGFRFDRADLELGRVHGVEQTLPFYQEIEFHPPSTYATGISQLEVTFLPTPERLQVVLEIDRRGPQVRQGRQFTGEHEAFGQFEVDYGTADSTDWSAQLDFWLRRSAERRGLPVD
jgi:sporulation-control protein